jgi:hypothetical protein
MAAIHQLYIEADNLRRRLEKALIRSYRLTGDSAQTFKIDRILDRAEYRYARRKKAMHLSTVHDATKGRNDAFSQMMDFYREGQGV